MTPGGLFWWIGAGMLIVLELLSGTLYLLMIALGFIAAAFAQWAGVSTAWQFALAGLFTLVAVPLLRYSKYGRKSAREAGGNPDLNLDIGQILSIPEWHGRRARANYRGAAWDVELAAGEPEDAHLYAIAALRGSCLIVVAHRLANDEHQPV
ncbi:NfeD family protein [Paraburkholderia bonniea]|uniref:NfeD family protein n=1 Tax=Paraburkholderia bonniea TaxID=2152891 RepID=UPI001291139D|nr:NfeD family protein [Paraburkholderia bonniea]WJF89196.1 NfeD family protein [Paraburkholderia bonniea]WJF92512.1 NfeD family protein [Paraburkholderia bonniea]